MPMPNESLMAEYYMVCREREDEIEEEISEEEEEG